MGTPKAKTALDPVPAPRAEPAASVPERLRLALALDPPPELLAPADAAARARHTVELAQWRQRHLVRLQAWSQAR